ncbi:MAG: CarD family transcriptional regulator [Candidatus Schekmanbacteria bacterium]|nr:CarD family transcriptional regulator [Candidatus Schekmanbacteria bacterium]
MFSAGDFLFYPAYGIGKVKGIEEQLDGGAARAYYILSMLDKKMSVRLPMENADAVGLRPLIGRQEVEMVFDILQEDPDVSQSQWNKRYQMNNEKLKTGSIYETAEVVRDLTQRNRKKTLGTKEARMLDTARQLLISEIAYVLDISEDAAGERIVQTLEREVVVAAE